jgi:hypothetical protein
MMTMYLNKKVPLNFVEKYECGDLVLITYDGKPTYLAVVMRPVAKRRYGYYVTVIYPSSLKPVICTAPASALALFDKGTVENMKEQMWLRDKRKRLRAKREKEGRKPCRRLYSLTCVEAVKRMKKRFNRDIKRLKDYDVEIMV